MRSAALTAAGLEAALLARAPGVHASTELVRQLAARVCRSLDRGDLAEPLADLSARVRDVGMVALPDFVVHNTSALSPQDWEILYRHPVLGAEMVEGLPALAALAPVIRSHHERWDGEGYPDGLRGEAIPLLSRVLATCDAFVAIASDRPHRRGVGADAALDHVRRQSGSQFDPSVVDALVEAVAGAALVRGDADAKDGGEPQGEAPPSRSATPPGVRGDLRDALAELEVIPAFAPAHERVLAATDAGEKLAGGELVAAIESDTGLTIAVLRRAQALESRRPIANVSDAVAGLSATAIHDAIEPLPLASFPWRTPFEAVLHRSRMHAQAVTRAAERIARVVSLSERDDLLVAALLHDVGRLVLVRLDPDQADGSESRELSPEERVAASNARSGWTTRRSAVYC